LIENSVKPKEKDLRKFQDGIYIIQKPWWISY
jgi:ribosomal protein L6P/L9E